MAPVCAAHTVFVPAQTTNTHSPNVVEPAGTSVAQLIRRGALHEREGNGSTCSHRRRVLWLASWMIHHANHVRGNDEIKVGGHQASCASIASIMTALYLRVLKPEDRVAVKPHASPIFHAIQYLAGNQSLEHLKNFRGYKGAQSYPSRTKDADDVDFSTGSVGLGVAQTLFSSLVQDYVKAHGWMNDRRDEWSHWSATPNWTKETYIQR